MTVTFVLFVLAILAVLVWRLWVGDSRRMKKKRGLGNER